VDKKIILFVGNLIKRKGVDTLIESIRIVHKQFPNLLVLIVGHGEERDKLELLTNTYGLTHNVKFLGAVQEDALADFYNSADAFILPSTSEGHSVALLEAMASGLSIIASNIDGNKVSVEDGVNGFFFEPSNIKDLAEKLTVMLTDDALREKMSVNSSKMYLEKFTTEVQIQNFLKVYRSLLNHHRP